MGTRGAFGVIVGERELIGYKNQQGVSSRRLLCIDDFRGYQPGDLIHARAISEDDLNFYWHDVNDDNGWAKSNYLALPKFAFVERT